MRPLADGAAVVGMTRHGAPGWRYTSRRRTAFLVIRMSQRSPLPSILPVGTAVVLLEQHVHGARTVDKGATGCVIRVPDDPEHSYRIRLTGGEELTLGREQFCVLSRFVSDDGAPDRLAEYDLGAFVIHRCVIGSRAYGLQRDGSDTDRRGIYLPPADLHWSLGGVPEQLENKHSEECYWELEKFLRLALKANPNVLEVLYSPLVELTTPLAAELIAERGRFVSRLVYQTYNGYVLSQFKKLQQRLQTTGAIQWKHAMHLVRLLLSGITALREGYVPVAVEEHRDRLLEIRDGRVPWTAVDAWRVELHRCFDDALSTTRLPERPDHAFADAFLRRARRSMVT